MNVKLVVGIIIIAAIVTVGAIMYLKPQTKAVTTNNLPQVPNESTINLPSSIETNTSNENVSLPEPNTTDITLPASI